MPRPADPLRRAAIVDQALRHVADVGFTQFSIRSVAAAIGQTTRVVTHHFRDKAALTAALLDRLDQREHEHLRTGAAWNDPAVPLSTIVRAAWERSLSDAELPYTRLIHEIEGLGTAGRTPAAISGFLTGRATFVAESLRARGVDGGRAVTVATLLNSAYTGLQIDYLTTGDHRRVTAALDLLCAWVDDAV